MIITIWHQSCEAHSLRSSGCGKYHCVPFVQAVSVVQAGEQVEMAVGKVVAISFFLDICDCVFVSDNSEL